MIPPDSEEKLEELGDEKVASIDQGEKAEEMSGKMKSQNEEDKLMHSVLENDQDTIDFGKLLSDSFNQGMGSFTPNMMFEQMVKNFSTAKKLYGQTMIRQLTGYDPDYVQKNIKIPEFAREIEKKIKDKIMKMKKEKLLDKEGDITDKGLELASLVMYVEELDKIEPKGFYGEKTHKKKSRYGMADDDRNYKKGDLYRDIAVRKTIKTAARRGHSKIVKEDLKVYEKKSKAHIYIIFGLDASGSMKGDKISLSKKAGIALAYKAIQEKDKVGMIAFGSDIKEKVEPTHDFMQIIKEITKVKASNETNLQKVIEEAIKMFPETDATKHLILLTDALPTMGDNPEKEVLDSVSNAKNHKITISLVGINLDDKGRILGEKIVELGNGKFYVCTDASELDQIVLEDYYNL